MVAASGRRPFLDGCPDPAVVGYRVDGTTIEIPISKTILNGSDRFSWDADAVWWGRQDDQVFEDRTVYIGESDRDLRRLAGTTSGNLFEVFHYPSMPKSINKVLSFVYERVPANDEIAVTFTDFRMDDLYGTGSGTGPINEPVHGIGEWQANPSRGEHFGSENLLVTMVPVLHRHPNFPLYQCLQRSCASQLCTCDRLDRARSRSMESKRQKPPTRPPLESIVKHHF